MCEKVVPWNVEQYLAAYLSHTTPLPQSAAQVKHFLVPTIEPTLRPREDQSEAGQRKGYAGAWAQRSKRPSLRPATPTVDESCSSKHGAFRHALAYHGLGCFRVRRAS